MKKLMTVTALLLSLLFAAATPAQYAGKTEFPTIGPGEKNKAYTFLVSEEVTITTPKGIKITGGETIAIPGELIEVLSIITPDNYEQKVTKLESFNQRTTLPKPVNRADSSALIALTVPEGAVIEHTDGRRVEGPTELRLIVKAVDLQKTDQAEPEAGMKQMGFAEK